MGCVTLHACGVAVSTTVLGVTLLVVTLVAILLDGYSSGVGVVATAALQRLAVLHLLTGH
jgi:hypothetical protein